MTQFFTCPIDHTPLKTDTPDRLVCATCHRSYSRREGVWHFLTAEQEQRIAATCEQDTIFLEQVGQELRYACQTLGADDCKRLLGAIVAAAGRT